LWDYWPSGALIISLGGAERPALPPRLLFGKEGRQTCAAGFANSPVRDQGGDQFGGGNVKGIVRRPAAVRRQLHFTKLPLVVPAPDVGDLPFVPLFDRDIA